MSLFGRGWPPWPVLASLGLAASGLVVSAVLTVEHFTDPGSLACPATSVVNCARVTTSPSASLFGIPVALLGLVFFAAMLVLCLPRAWRDPRLARLRLGLAGTGVAFVIYLIYAELFLVNAICLWCTVVHAIAIALFAVIAVTAAGTAAGIAAGSAAGGAKGR